MTRTILLAAAMLAAFAGNAAAATYYVDCDDPAASDSYNETQAQNEATPLKTLWYAGWMAKPGDTVLVKDGVCPHPETAISYGDYSQAAYFTQNGEQARLEGKPYWTTFKAYLGHHPRIRFRVLHENGIPSNGIHIEGSYIIVDGFEVFPEDYQPNVTYEQGNGIYATDGDTTASHHIIVRNCNVHDCPSSGIGGMWVDYMTIENNTVWNNSWWAGCNTSGVGFYQPHAIDLDYGATVVNGKAYRIVIANNRIYGNENKVPPSKSCIPWAETGAHPYDGNGIILDDFGCTQPSGQETKYQNVLYPHRTLITNNVIYGNGGRGILGNSGYTDVLHNTVYNNLQSQGVRDNCGALGEIALSGFDMRVFNNIAVAQYNNALWLKYDYPFVGYPTGTEPKISYGNNLSYGGGMETDSGASNAGGNFTQDPLLAAPSLAGDADFHLKKGSPAINKGSAENSVPTDFEGRTRPVGGLPDIGAYETNYTSANGGMCILPAVNLLLQRK